jgi:hypothetical protein
VLDGTALKKKEIVMKDTNKVDMRFVNKLCKFILREQGRGFAMEDWVYNNAPVGEVFNTDGVDRKIPKCGTVACIGGSIQCLASPRKPLNSEEAGKLIGLNEEDANILFYEWETSWPEPFLSKYAKAKTAYTKAKVAVAMLKEAIKTRGACFHTEDY